MEAWTLSSPNGACLGGLSSCFSHHLPEEAVLRQPDRGSGLVAISSAASTALQNICFALARRPSPSIQPRHLYRNGSIGPVYGDATRRLGTK